MNRRVLLGPWDWEGLGIGVHFAVWNFQAPSPRGRWPKDECVPPPLGKRGMSLLKRGWDFISQAGEAVVSSVKEVVRDLTAHGAQKRQVRAPTLQGTPYISQVNTPPHRAGPRRHRKRQRRRNAAFGVSCLL
eukprot:COSAG01_NODE_13939_length_1516_cov_1.313338_2_plen_132_part_00